MWGVPMRMWTQNFENNSNIHEKKDKLLDFKAVVGVDPGYAHGCKIAVIDAKSGAVLDSCKIYPPTENNVSKSRNFYKQFVDILEKFAPLVFSIGNGTGSRTAEELVREALQKFQDF